MESRSRRVPWSIFWSVMALYLQPIGRKLSPCDCGPGARPTEYLGHEFSAGRVASVLGCNGAYQTELCLRPPGLILSVGRRHTQVNVRVPLGDASRNSLVQIIPVRILGRGVYHTD